jgi:hypothetical protein
MRTVGAHHRRWPAVLAAVGAFATCCVAAVIPAAARHAPLPPAGLGNCPSKHLIYLIVGEINAVLVYPQNRGLMQNQCGQLTTGMTSPEGLATDSSGNLYVTNAGNSSVPATIEKFAPQASEPMMKIVDTGGFPIGVAIARNGDIVVANEIAQPGSGPGDVVVFDRHGRLLATLTDPNAQYELFPAVDSHGNIFTTYLDFSFIGHVNEFVGSSVVELPIVLQFPGSLRFDRDNLLVMDNVAKTISTYPPPYQTATSVLSLTAAVSPIAFDLIGSGKALYTADGGNSQSQEYTYPGGALINTINPPSGLVSGVALSPDHSF